MMMRQEKILLLAGFIVIVLLLPAPNIKAQDRKFIHYTNNDGLPYSAITNFVQDNQGFMWVAMRNSICRFDGYEFIEYTPYDTAGNITPLKIPVLFQDIHDNLFLTTNESRLFSYSSEMDRFDEIILPGNLSFTNLSPSSDGGLWLISGGRVKYISALLDSLYDMVDIYPFLKKDVADFKVVRMIDNRGMIILLMEDHRLLFADPATGKVSIAGYDFSSPENIQLFSADRYSNLWVSDAENGLTRFSLSGGTRLFFSSSSSGSRRIPHNMVRSVVYDNDGNIWMGTENGLAIWSPVYETMEYHSYDPANPDGLNSNAIYRLYADKNGNIWIGTYFGGINIWYSGHEFFSIISSGFGPYDLGGKEVSCLTEDPDGNIWVGLEGNGVNVIDAKTGMVTRYTFDPNANSLSYNNVHALLYGPDNKMYIGTYTGGLNILDPATGRFTHISSEKIKLFPSDNIYALHRHNDSILIGTDNGIAVLNTLSGEYSLFHPEIFEGGQVESFCETDSEIWISKRNVLNIWYPGNDSIAFFDRLNGIQSISFITTDSKDNIWIGDSYAGLLLFDRIRDTVITFSPADGFPASRVYGLIEGLEGWYWVSSAKGLIKFRPSTNTYITFNTGSGLPFNQFNFNAYYRDSNNRLYFGGINGLVSFENSDGYQSQSIESIVFSRAEVFNRDIKPGPKSQLRESINLSRELRLKYREKNFSVYFSALNFTHPGRIQYAYYLEGFSPEWNYPGSRNSATYTNLSPGKYYLHVKASLDNYTWTTEEAVLKIVVKPPFPLSPFAFIVYGLLVTAALIVFWQVSVKIEKSKALTIIERNEKIQEKRLSQAKLEFFTNVSHELRTPLTLIIGPLTSIIRSDKISQEIKDKLHHINDNARRLLALINQLMEFRKTEQGKVPLKVAEGDLNIFVREIKEAFDTVADMREIDFRLENSTPYEAVWFDHEKIERILFNLISNAFKYTGDKGKIILRISSGMKAINDTAARQCIIFELEDNGVGIEESKLERIFERFYQADEKDRLKGGSGIGLALVRNLVSIHKGEIVAESVRGSGSVFRFWIPGKRESYSENEIFTGDVEYIVNTEELVGLELNKTGKIFDSDNMDDCPVVLVVDDNTELLSFLSESLSEKFRVVTAVNGIKALEAIEETTPDLIISDIIMPVMDGIELTKRIKSSIETSHIPVILLTAKTEIENKYEGMMTGADSYIEKPFYPHILLKHIENIISTRERLVSTFKYNLSSEPVELAHSTSDKEFIEKLSAIINNNIDNPDLDVTFVVSEMSISRSLLHLKLKKIAGCSATGYIRILRLKKAARLMLEEGKNSSEAAYLTGFSSPAFFSRRFKEYFGTTPSQYSSGRKTN